MRRGEAAWLCRARFAPLTREVLLAADFDFSVLYGEFREEARDQLEELDAALLSLESDGALPAERRGELLRTLHTLKGNAAMLGLGTMRDFVHSFETVFREGRGWPQAAVDTLFESAAALRRAVDETGTPDQEAASTRLEAIAPQLAAAAETGSGTSVTADAAATLPPFAAAGEAGAEAASQGSEETASPAEESAGEPAPEIAAADYLRVPFAKLDALLNQVAGLVQALGVTEDLVKGGDAVFAPGGALGSLEEQVDRLGRIADGLRRTAMELRLVPVQRVFRRFPSLVRDLAHEREKRVQVILEGESTELDKSTVDRISEPLLHLIRNALDHGIEPPHERVAAGKPPEGRVTLRASQAGDQVRIEVEDDGRGIDLQAVRRRAEQAGIVSPGHTLGDAATRELIFTPGFTTRSAADALSGRGIGMDVVRERMSRLRGSVTIESPRGGGTRFVLRLPLTVAVVPAVLFEAGDEVLALPVGDVAVTLRNPVTERAGAAWVIRHGEELLPVASTTRLFGGNSNGAASGANPPFALVVRHGTRAAAVMADRLLDQRGIVVKALPGYLGNPPGITGVSVAPDGRVLLLLDAAALIDLNLQSHRREPDAR